MLTIIVISMPFEYYFDVKLSSLRKTSIIFFIEEYHLLQKECFTNHLKKVKI